MFLRVTFLVVVTCQPYEINTLRACVPNTFYILNDRLCLCNIQGRWSESKCKNIARRQPCSPGKIVWQGCNQCICQENGQLLCTSTYCSNHITKPALRYHSLAEYGPRCTPFHSYYVNCSLCFCPASGKATDAQCAADASCSLDYTSDIMTITKRNQCIPNVMYLFPCIQCFCSEVGLFIHDKCVEKCQYSSKYRRRCIPGTLYRKDCNVCRCPDDSVPDETLCINTDCNANTKQTYLHPLRTTTNHCIPHTFTRPKCIYCDCSSEGVVNEYSCLELDCSKISGFQYYRQTDVCSPGELVPICMECFCLNNGLTNGTYCTRICTNNSKLNMLEKVLNDSRIDSSLIDKTKIKTVGRNKTCEPRKIYRDKGKYCICLNTGNTNFKLCTLVIEDSKQTYVQNKIKFDVTKNCEPNTLVDFDCNTCYCSKSGKIDPKWCTYDDCETKRIVVESHNAHPTPAPIEDPNGACTPGSISKVECNFCICPDSGILRQRACTKTDCFDNVEIKHDKFVCEPLAYYEVDCNICYCPRDGLKNVAKCTKYQCEKSFLRSEGCTGGHLFSDECNVCVCPPNGDKADRVCTNNTCSFPRWNTFKLSDSVLENKVQDDTTRNLDLCFPGEEFSMGCNLCVCPDLGLKVYASCEPVLCDEKSEDIKSIEVYGKQSQNLNDTTPLVKYEDKHARARRDVHDRCYIYKISRSAERHDCTPGSMYIVRCKQCICPYLGTINNFCRPLPKTFYCEEAYPGFNFLAMGRRNRNFTTSKSKMNKESITVTVKHSKHTIYECDNTGKLIDQCFICDCEDNVVIEEHCFKSDAENCSDATPTFFSKNKVILV